MDVDRQDSLWIMEAETLADKIFNLGSNLNINKEELKNKLNYSFLGSIGLTLEDRTVEEMGYFNKFLNSWIACHEIKLKEDAFLWLSVELSKQHQKMYESTQLFALSAETVVNQANIEKIKNTYVIRRKEFFYNIFGLIREQFNDLIETKRYILNAAEINLIKGDIKGLYITKKNFETIFEAFRAITRESYSHSAYKGSKYAEDSEYTLDIICYFAQTLCGSMADELEKKDAFWEKHASLYEDLVKDNKRLFQKLEEKSQIASQTIGVADKEIITLNQKIDGLKKNEDELNKRITSLEDELKKARTIIDEKEKKISSGRLSLELGADALERRKREFRKYIQEAEAELENLSAYVAVFSTMKTLIENKTLAMQFSPEISKDMKRTIENFFKEVAVSEQSQQFEYPSHVKKEILKHVEDVDKKYEEIQKEFINAITQTNKEKDDYLDLKTKLSLEKLELTRKEVELKKMKEDLNVEYVALRGAEKDLVEGQNNYEMKSKELREKENSLKGIEELLDSEREKIREELESLYKERNEARKAKQAEIETKQSAIKAKEELEEKKKELEKYETKLKDRETAVELREKKNKEDTEQLEKARKELENTKDNIAQKESGIEDKIKEIETKENKIKERFVEIETLEKKYGKIEEEYNQFRTERQKFDRYVGDKEKEIIAGERMLKNHRNLAIIIQTPKGDVMYNDVAMKAYNGEPILADNSEIKYDVFLTQNKIPVSISWKYKIPPEKGKKQECYSLFIGVVNTAEYSKDSSAKKS